MLKIFLGEFSKSLLLFFYQKQVDVVHSAHRLMTRTRINADPTRVYLYTATIIVLKKGQLWLVQRTKYRLSPIHSK